MTTKAIKLRHFLTGRLFTLKNEVSNRKVQETCLGKEMNFSGLTVTQNLGLKNKTSKFDNIGPAGGEDDDDDSDYFEDEDSEENRMYQTRNHSLYFELVIVEEKYLRNKSLVYLKSKNSYLDCSKIPYLERRNIRGTWESEKMIKPLNNKDTDEKKKIIIFKDIKDTKIHKNILILNKVSIEIKNNMLFLRSMMPKFLKFISLLKEAKWNKIKYHTFLEITDLFKRIVEYLFGESKCVNDNYWNISEQPSAQK